MFRKLRITGRNKGVRFLSALLAVLLLMAMPFSAAAEEQPPAEQPPAEQPPAEQPSLEQPLVEPTYSISVSGFEFTLDPADDYYMIFPADFTACSIDGYEGFLDLKVGVEQYVMHYPYMKEPYVLGNKLDLGYGRAKVTLYTTLADGTAKNYTLHFTDPNALENCYAKVVVNSSVRLRAAASTDAEVLANLNKGTVVYYLGTEGDWAKIQYVRSVYSNGVLSQTISHVGYVKDTAEENYIRWNWESVEMPSHYASAIQALQAAHPNWTFSFVDPEITYGDAVVKYGASREQYIDPLYYLNEDRIFAFLDIDTYDPERWTDEGVKAIWANEKTITKDQALAYFNAASASLQMNPYYIACRAALESGYGGSKFAQGTIEGYEGYYNFFGIKCYDSDPTVGAQYAKERNWNTVEVSITEGANWVKDQYLDRGAITPYFFRYSGFWNKSYMTDAQAPAKEAQILKRAFSDPNAKAHFVIPVYKSQFLDLDSKSWYYGDTLAAIDAGIFNGLSETEFGPQKSMTRAQFVTALSRLCGVDVSTYEVANFTDVSPNNWHYRYVAWAYAVGVTEGVSATAFSPNREITRQEMCKMLGNAIENVMGKSLIESPAAEAAPEEGVEQEQPAVETASEAQPQEQPIEETVPEGQQPQDQPAPEGQEQPVTENGAAEAPQLPEIVYNDKDTIAAWAVEWVQKCSAAGIFKGNTQGNFNPKNNARRCEAATVFYRCYQKYVQE